MSLAATLRSLFAATNNSETKPAQQMQSRFAADVLANNPSVVVILGGTNDLALLESPNIDAISAMAQTAATAGVRVVVGTVLPSELWLGSTFLTQAIIVPDQQPSVAAC